MLMSAGLLLALLAVSAYAFEPFFNFGGKPLAATGTVQAVFTPGDDVAKSIIAAINKAQRQIRVQAFSFTHRNIARALIAAKGRGLDVKVIADKGQTENIPTSVIPEIAAGGVLVMIDSDHASAHDKVMVIDPGSPGVVLITGSFNFTQAAQFKNAENVLILSGHAALADLYLKNWQRHFEHARPYRDALLRSVP